MSEAPSVALIERLDGVDDMNRTLAVGHLTFIVNRLDRLRQEVAERIAASPTSLDHLWPLADEIAVQDALVFFGAPEDHAGSVDALWNVWGRMLLRQLTDGHAPDMRGMLTSVANVVEVFAVVRRRIMAMGDHSEDDQIGFIYMLGSPVH